MKSIIKLVFIISIIFSIVPTYSYTNTQIDSANYLASEGIIVDNSKNTKGYRLDDYILRQELVGIVSKASGTSISFKQTEKVTRIDALALIVDTMYEGEYVYNPELYSSNDEQLVQFAVSKGITREFTDYNTRGRRGFVFEILANTMKNLENNNEHNTPNEEAKNLLCELLGICETEEEIPSIVNDIYTDDNGYSNYNPPIIYDDRDSIITSGDLEVSLNPNSPRGQSIPASGIVLFGKFDFSSYLKDITLESITLKREGLGERSDIRRVYLEKNGIRVTNRVGILTDGTVELYFQPELVIYKGSTITLDLMVELGDKPGLGDEHRFTIRDSNDIEASTSVSGDFPITTGSMGVSSYTTSSVEIQPIYNSYTYNGKYNNARLSEFRLYTSSSSDYTLKGITFRNMGDANMEKYLSDVKLLRNGKEVSYNYFIDGRNLNIDIYDEIDAGETAYYELEGDINGWDRNGEKYELEIRNSSDISIIETETGFAPSVDIR